MNGHLRLVPPAIVRPAALEPGTLFWFWGRPLKVIRVLGQDAAAPVIVEELQAGPGFFAGQYALWSVDCVRQVMLEASRRRPRMRSEKVIGTG